MIFSNRTQWQHDSNPLTEVINQFKTSKISYIDLTISNPTKCDFHYPVNDILTPLLNEQNLSYVPQAQGIDSARQEVAQYYARKNQRVNSDHILLTASSSEAYTYLFRLLANSGDRILIPRPSYPLFQFLAQINDLEIDTYSLSDDQRWSIDMNELESLITERTRAILCVNPNNPTGSFIKKDELAQLNALCKKYSISIICDEVFTDFVIDRDENSVPTLCEQNSVFTCVIGGLSKALAMPQMKLSWTVITGPKEDVQEALRRLDIIADTFLSVNTMAQYALPHWFKLQSMIQTQINKRISANYYMLKNMCDAHLSFQCIPIEGGWYGVIHIDNVDDDEAWAITLLKEKKLLLHPGYLYDFDDSGYFVVSLIVSTNVFQQACQILQEC